jgi:hypothetical protein
MKRAYLFAYSALLGTFEQVKAHLDSMPSVETWRTDIPNTFYLISEVTAKQIADELHARSGQSVGRFIVTEIPANSYGWLTAESWFLIQNLRHKP